MARRCGECRRECGRYLQKAGAHLRRHDLAYGVPVRPADLVEQPVMPLSSGYVQRAMASLPVQGRTEPWFVRQNYFLDSLQMRRADLTRDMRFTSRADLAHAESEPVGSGAEVAA